MDGETRLFSDEVRRRERARRRREPLWGFLSFLLHAALFAVLVLLTPVRELVAPEEVKDRTTTEIAADRVEDMRSVLHNMDVMKEELAKDYDRFAERSAADVRKEMEALVAETESAQRDSAAAQDVVKAAVKELVVIETRRNLSDEAVAKELLEKGETLMRDTAEKTATAQANAVNALDKLQVRAEFAGYGKTAEVAEKLRDAQIEAGRMQDAAQNASVDAATKLSEVARNERRVRELRERMDAARTKAEEAERKRTEAEAAIAKESDAVAAAERRRDELRKDGKFNEAKVAQRELQGHASALEKAKRATKDAQRRADEAGKVTARTEPELAKALEKQKELDEARRKFANDGQLSKVEEAKKAQMELNEKIAILKETLAADASQLERLSQGEERRENELVLKAAPEGMALAYELAKELEAAITESYKDIKATETAISKKMSVSAAKKITDVARPERLAADVAALEAKPRTKEDFDRQKAAQADVVREADAMVEATVAMMNDAMEIVMAGEDSGPKLRNDDKPFAVRRLEAEDFAERSSDEAMESRVAAMSAESEFRLAMEAAAAEDSSAKAKDLAALMARDGDGKGSEGSRPSDDEPLPPLEGGSPELQPGNVMRASGGDGVPAQWMYVNSWYVIGPFPNPNRVNLRRKFAPESVQDLDATYVGKDGKTLRWEFMQARNSDETFWWGGVAKNAAEVVPQNKEEYSIFYAYAEVFMDEECDRWISVGSDDRSDVWINDMPVWASSNKLKEWRLDEDYRRVHFKKGRNKILVRIENGHWNLGWSLCISTGSGK